MFYKFKINYNKSEFSLSCLDRDIIERETDLYFAFFADASEEFISKIKKIEVAHPKIKKIDEIVSHALNGKNELPDEKIESAINDNVVENKVVFTNKSDDKQNVECENTVLKISDAYNIAFDKKGEEKIEGIYSIKQIPQEVSEEENSQQVKISEENTQDVNIENEDITKKFGFDNLEPNLSPEYSEIQDMIKLAQSKIEAIDAKKQLEIHNVSTDAPEITIKDKQVENKDFEKEMEINLLQHFANDINDKGEENAVQEIVFADKIEVIEDVANVQLSINDAIADGDVKEPSIAEEIIAQDRIIEEVFANDVIVEEAEEKLENSTEKNNKELLDDIFSKNINDDKISKEFKNKIENIEIKEAEFNTSNKKVISDEFGDLVFKTNKTEDFLNLQNETPAFQIQQPTEAELREFAQNLDNALKQSIEQQDGDSETCDRREVCLIEESNNEQNVEIKYENCAPEAPVFNDIPIQQDDDAEIPLQEKFNPMEPIDFSSFLSIFQPASINDEFLICAYYLKNIANEQNFTMKSINAKLFKALGKIAGISVIEDLIELGLIEKLQDIETNSYVISPDGEKYFEDKFQR